MKFIDEIFGEDRELNIYGAMNYIESFSKMGVPVKNLDRFRLIMEELGNPQERLRFIHVAGTNGKGSTVRMLASALTNAGYVTGEYTSPYIRVYNDRIRIDGENISDSELCEIVSQIRPIMDGMFLECSQFELTTAIAFIYFAAKKCDVVVLEAGLGGLLDCTNIITKPELSIITSVSLDHTQILGDTVELIARQKAGIIKVGCPVVLACNQERKTVDVVHGTASAMACEFRTPDIEKLKIEESGETGSKFRYKGNLYIVSMIGKHQIDNALTVIEAAEILRRHGFSALTYSTVFDGIKEASVPSRCQVLRAKKPFVIIDGAHNPGGMRALADFVRTLPYDPKIMICGMMADKDWSTALGFMTRYIDYGICVDGFAPKTVFAPKLADLFREAQVMSVADALPRAVSLAGDHGMVIIAGSLYLAAAIKKMTV